MPDIDKKLIDELAELSKIDLESQEYVEDFEEIVDYFEKLQEVDTGDVEPSVGGSNRKNAFRLDDSKEKRIHPAEARDDFPEERSEYLRIPPVFKDKD